MLPRRISGFHSLVRVSLPIDAFVAHTIEIQRIIDTFDVVLTGHLLYYYLVLNFLNPLALAVPVW